jgi:MFS family permease
MPTVMPQRPGSPYLLILGTPTIMWIIISGALHNFNMYALNAFVPALARRYYVLTESNAGLVAGVILGAVGIVGLLGGGWVADRVQRVRPNGRLLVAATAMLLSAPCLYFGVSQPPEQVWSFMAWVGVGVMLMYVYYAGVYAAIQDVVEPGLRGTAMALYFFVMYVLGGAFGTYVLGLMSDKFAIQAATAAGKPLVAGHAPEQFRAVGLHQAMYIVPLFCFGLAVVLFAASRTVTGDMRKLAKWYDESSSQFPA